MEPGSTLVADTDVGQLTITALSKTKRRFQWDGYDRTINAYPRQARWDGKLGLTHAAGRLFFKGPIRVVYGEAHLNYNSMDELLHHIQLGENPVYTADGLSVGASGSAQRHGISVGVFQYLLNGKKPQNLPGAGQGKLEFKR